MAKIQFPQLDVNNYLKEIIPNFYYTFNEKRAYIRERGKFVPIGWYVEYYIKKRGESPDFSNSKKYMVLDSDL